MGQQALDSLHLGHVPEDSVRGDGRWRRDEERRAHRPRHPPRRPAAEAAASVAKCSQTLHARLWLGQDFL